MRRAIRAGALALVMVVLAALGGSSMLAVGAFMVGDAATSGLADTAAREGSSHPHRVLVLGTGPEARLVEASLATASSVGIRLVGFHALEKVQRTVVSRRRIIAQTGPLEETVKRLDIDEIIVAVREQRGGVLPLRALLECRLNGVRVTGADECS